MRCGIFIFLFYFFLLSGNVSKAAFRLTLFASCWRGRTTTTQNGGMQLCLEPVGGNFSHCSQEEEAWRASVVHPEKPRMMDCPPDTASSDRSIGISSNPPWCPHPQRALQSLGLYQIHCVQSACLPPSLFSPLILIRFVICPRRSDAELYCRHHA